MKITLFSLAPFSIAHNNISLGDNNNPRSAMQSGDNLYEFNVEEGFRFCLTTPLDELSPIMVKNPVSDRWMVVTWGSIRDGQIIDTDAALANKSEVRDIERMIRESEEMLVAPLN